MKKILALAMILLASAFGRGAVANTTATVTVNPMGLYQLVTINAAPGGTYEVFSIDSTGTYSQAALGWVGADGIGHSWILSATYSPPPGMPSVYVLIHNADGTTTYASTIQDDGWWLE